MKLYCGCQYAVLNEFNNVESATTFVNRMASLRWVIIKVSSSEDVNITLVTKPNLQLIQIIFHLYDVDGDNVNFDLSASTNLHTIFIENPILLQTAPRVTARTLPLLEVIQCRRCTFVDFNPCESQNLRSLWLLYSYMLQPNDCLSDLHYLESFIVKNRDLRGCEGRCMQRVPELPPSLIFLLLDSQNITEIAIETALADIEMISLWGNAVCGIYIN